MQKVALIILRNIKSIGLIDKAIKDGFTRIIASTDDIRLHSTLKNNPHIESVTFIDQMISIYEVSGDVLKLRDVINSWLKSQLPDIPAYFLNFIKHAEGGNSTQKIVDAVILINSLIKIFQRNSITDVYIKRGYKFKFDDDIITAAAFKEKIKVHEVKTLNYYSGSFLNLVPWRLDSVGGKGIIFFPQKLKTIIKILRTFLIILIAKFSREEDELCGHEKVLFIAEGNAEKATNALIPLMYEFNSLENYHSILLLWRGFGSKKRIKRLGLDARNLEAYYNIRRYPQEILWHRKIWNKIRKSIGKLKLNYNGILLEMSFRDIILNFIQEELLQRKIIFESANVFFSKNNPAILRSRADFRLDLDILCFNSLMIYNMIHGGKPFIFTNQTALNFGEFYGESEINAVDLFFVIGSWERKILSEILKYSDIRIGSRISASGLQYKTRGTKKSAIQKLKINRQSDYNVCFFSSNIVRGVYSHLESSLLIQTLIGYVLKKNINLIIKPHPSEDIELVNQIINYNANPNNVFCLARNSDIVDCLDACDIIIQKISTVGIETMYYRKPVIAFSLDGEKRFMDFWEGGCEVFMDSESLLKHLDCIFESDSKFKAWSEKQITSQDEFLLKRFLTFEIPHEKFIVNNVIEKYNKNISV